MALFFILTSFVFFRHDYFTTFFDTKYWFYICVYILCGDFQMELIDILLVVNTMFRRTFTSEEEQEIQRRTGLQYHAQKGCQPWRERWKSSVAFSDMVSPLNAAVTHCDIMITLCPEGKTPINMIFDTCYNTLYCIHVKLCELLGDEFGRITTNADGYNVFEPPISDFEYSCEINEVDEVENSNKREQRFVEDGLPVTFKRVKKLLKIGNSRFESCEEWLMNGHVIQVIQVRKK